MEDQEIIREFLIESIENLARVDREMVELEQHPRNLDLLASVFRTVHTIKGTCGFLGFPRLEALSHAAEGILSDLRKGQRELDGPLTTLLLETMDIIKRILLSIENNGGEGPEVEGDLLRRLERAAAKQSDETPAASAAIEVAPAPSAPSPPTTPSPTAPAAPSQPVSEDSGATRPTSVADTTLRVDIDVLDRLMDLVGELVLTRNQVLAYNSAQDDSELSGMSQRLNMITAKLQEGVMKTRMQPISVIWNKLPRVIRDLAAALHKEIVVEMEGADTELDRAIIEAIKDPLTHIVRNSCDHGIEKPEDRLRRGKAASGRISLRAFHEGGQVNIVISDDGSGIDPQKVKAKALERGLINAQQAERLSDRDAVNLVFLPGFSTAQAVTSISGRGVGMDVVRTHIDRIGGTVDLLSKPGEGATVRVKIPLTLAIVPGLMVEAGAERFIIPQASLHELIRLEGDAVQTRIEHIHTTPVYRLRDVLVPLVDLSQILKLTPQRAAGEISIVMLAAGEERFGLIVDSIGDTQEIVVKPLGQQLKGVDCYAGATIMGDGRIALILDVPGLAARAGVHAASQDNARGATASQGAGARANHLKKPLLLFRAGTFSRLAVPLSQVARLENIAASKVEWASGQAVVQYRNHVLPLISVAEMLGCAASDSELLHVVVARNRASDLGLVVDEILDVVEDEVSSPFGSSRSGLLGSGVVGGLVTDFLDLDSAAAQCAAGAESLGRLARVISPEPECEEVFG
jgi:two-component system chemotaxis sensor kinase CheA